MKVERFSEKACCNKGKNITFKIDRPITAPLIQFLVEQGFREAAHFTKAGMLYVDNSDLIITGPIGANRINVKCKKDDCDQIINDFQELLTKIE